MEDLAGKVALVTGAGSGIGRALALELASRGMDVVAADIDPGRAEDTAAAARRFGRQSLALACDVSDASAVAEMSGSAQALGPIALLCANAGVTAFKPFVEMSDADVDWIIAVDLMGVSHCVRAVLPGMIAAKSGHIVTVASMAGLAPSWAPIHVPYTAAKAGVIGMTVNLRTEVAPHGVGCTVLCPGGVSTNIARAAGYRPERFGGPTDDTIKPPTDFTSGNAASFVRRTPEQVARMTVDAVVANRLFVVTDSAMRSLFDAYAAEVAAAFDAAAAYERQDEKSAG